jgi:signal transduction histidine kinase
MTGQLRELVGTLEQRVTERTRDLQIAADVSKQITTVLDIKELLQQVVTLTAQNFKFSSTFVFLLDDSGKNLVRSAGANAQGQSLTVEGIESLSIDAEPSIIALAARSREMVTVNDVGKSPLYLPVKSLPNTRAEVAIPMIAGDQLLGVFDVQSDLVNRFSSDDLRVLRTMSEQIAIAARNAELFAEAERARQAAEDANKVKSQFLANMSHELRTPLNAILNFTGFVVDGILGDVNPEQADALSKAIDSGQHLLSLINDILDLTKIEVGMMDLFIQDVDMSSTLKSTCSTAKGLIKGKPVELIVDIEENLPAISGDRRRVRQVFLNLASNAAKFTTQGSITIRARLTDGEIVVSIRDTGIGIAPEDRSAVFESFKQAKHELAEISGTGLGMPISKYFVEAHGGRMWFESEKGVGSTFYVAFPVNAESSKAALESVAP